MILASFSLQRARTSLELHSFPTRRSSDLSRIGEGLQSERAGCDLRCDAHEVGLAASSTRPFLATVRRQRAPALCRNLGSLTPDRRESPRRESRRRLLDQSMNQLLGLPVLEERSRLPCPQRQQIVATGSGSGRLHLRSEPCLRRVLRNLPLV